MDKNNNNYLHCQYCGCECDDHVVRDEDYSAYCSKECLLADRLRWRI